MQRGWPFSRHGSEFKNLKLSFAHTDLVQNKSEKSRPPVCHVCAGAHGWTPGLTQPPGSSQGAQCGAQRPTPANLLRVQTLVHGRKRTGVDRWERRDGRHSPWEKRQSDQGRHRAAPRGWPEPQGRKPVCSGDTSVPDTAGRDVQWDSAWEHRLPACQKVNINLPRTQQHSRQALPRDVNVSVNVAVRSVIHKSQVETARVYKQISNTWSICTAKQCVSLTRATTQEPGGRHTGHVSQSRKAMCCVTLLT